MSTINVDTFLKRDYTMQSWFKVIQFDSKLIQTIQTKLKRESTWFKAELNVIQRWINAIQTWFKRDSNMIQTWFKFNVIETWYIGGITREWNLIKCDSIGILTWFKHDSNVIQGQEGN